MAHTNACPKGIDLILKRVSFGRFQYQLQEIIWTQVQVNLGTYKRGTPNLHKSAVFWAFNWTAPSGGMQIHDTDGERAEFTVFRADLNRFERRKLGVLLCKNRRTTHQHTCKERFYPRRRGLESTNPGISTQITVTYRDLPSLKLRGFLIGFLTYTRLGLQQGNPPQLEMGYSVGIYLRISPLAGFLWKHGGCVRECTTYYIAGKNFHIPFMVGYISFFSGLIMVHPNLHGSSSNPHFDGQISGIFLKSQIIQNQSQPIVLHALYRDGTPFRTPERQNTPHTYKHKYTYTYIYISP